MDAGLLFIIFLLIDVLLLIKPIPIVAFPTMLFFLYFGATQFYPLSTVDLPFNPLTSIFFILFCVLSMVRNALDMKD